MPDSGGVALPEIRELLFADLPPLTAMETFAAVADLRDMAQATAREDEPTASEILARIVDGTTESRVRLQAWSLARRVGIEPPSDDARRVRGVVVDVGFDAGIDTLAGYEDGTARYLNQGGGGIVWETADETVGATIKSLLQAGRAERNGTELTVGTRPSRGTRRGGGSTPPGAQSRPHDCDSRRADRAPWRAP